MIYIEIRIGRTPPVANPPALMLTHVSASSVGASAAPARGFRIGNGGAAALLAGVLGLCAFGLVPAGDTPQASTLAPARAVVAAVPPMSAPVGAVAAPVRSDIVVPPEQFVPVQPEDSAPASESASPPSARWDGTVAQEAATPRSSDTRLAWAITRDVSALPSDTRRARADSASDIATEHASPAESSAASNDGALVDPTQATPVERQTAESTTVVSQAAAATEQAAVAPTEPPSFSLTREERPETQSLVDALRAQAALGNWDAVQSLRRGYSGKPSLALAKWDARIALALGQPDIAASALAPFATSLDDEAQRLRAVGLLKSGAASAAIEAYRGLLASHPDDAQLWLGLGIALEDAAADGEAIRYAFGQTLQLSKDPTMRQLAQMRLDAHRV